MKTMRLAVSMIPCLRASRPAYERVDPGEELSRDQALTPYSENAAWSLDQPANATIALSYQPLSAPRPFFWQKPANLSRYGTGSTRRFQHSFRRQPGHRCIGLRSFSSWGL